MQMITVNLSEDSLTPDVPFAPQLHTTDEPFLPKLETIECEGANCNLGAASSTKIPTDVINVDFCTIYFVHP